MAVAQLRPAGFQIDAGGLPLNRFQHLCSSHGNVRSCLPAHPDIAVLEVDSGQGDARLAQDFGIVARTQQDLLGQWFPGLEVAAAFQRESDGHLLGQSGRQFDPGDGQRQGTRIDQDSSLFATRFGSVRSRYLDRGVPGLHRDSDRNRCTARTLDQGDRG